MECFYVGAHGRTDQVGLPLATSVILGSREPSKDNEFTSYVPFSDNASNLGVAIVAPDLEFVVPEENGEFPKSAGEVNITKSLILFILVLSYVSVCF